MQGRKLAGGKQRERTFRSRSSGPKGEILAGICVGTTMVKSCCAINCNNKFSLGNNISFHRFPLGKKEVLKRWVWNIRRKNFTPTRHHVICSEHFREADYLENVASGRRYLKPEAIPTVFNIPERLKKGAKRRRPLLRQKPADPPPSGRPLKAKESAELPSPGNDVVGLEHSYSLQASPALADLDLQSSSMGEQGPTNPPDGKGPLSLPARPWRACRERTRPNASEEPIVNSDLQRQRFRQFRYQEHKGPREVCSQLWELCHQWLKPGRHTKLQMLELVILEQFLAILPQEMQDYVKESGPASCDEAVGLVEDFVENQRGEEAGRPLAQTAADFPESSMAALDARCASKLRRLSQNGDGTVTLLEDGTLRNHVKNVQKDSPVSEEGEFQEDISSEVEIVESCDDEMIMEENAVSSLELLGKEHYKNELPKTDKGLPQTMTKCKEKELRVSWLRLRPEKE
ncbi:SCAN domain-containing protein 3 [Varanus komodoensis]|nr:SCAN domain-containing protein 3 [Varanus komodoensis]